MSDDLVERVARAIYEAWCAFHGVTKTSMPWDDVWGEERQACIAEARASIAVVLEAWPGVIQMHHPRDSQHAIILPLPQDASDE